MLKFSKKKTLNRNRAPQTSTKKKINKDNEIRNLREYQNIIITIDSDNIIADTLLIPHWRISLSD